MLPKTNYDIRLPWHVKTQTSHIGIKFISRIGIQIYFSPAVIIVYTQVSREGILAKLGFCYFFTMPLHVSSFTYFECSYHTLPKDIMFTSTPVKHFSSPINIPSTATSSYLLFISAEGKGYNICVFVHPVSLSGVPVMWPLLRHHGELISVMLVTRLQRTKKIKRSESNFV